MSNRSLLALAALALAFAAAPAAIAQTANSPSPAAVKGGTFKLDSSHSKITWSINHFGFSTYVGQFAKAEGVLQLEPQSLDKSTLDVMIDTASLGTLNPALDGRVKGKDFLDVATFPTATFHATKVTRTGERTADIAGDLTLRGVTKPVVVHASFVMGGKNPVDPAYRLGFAGEAKIVRSEYGVSGLLPNLGDEVTLTIEAEFRQQPPAAPGG